MIDYKKLRGEFSKKLQEFDKEKLVKWMEFDCNRDILSRLLHVEVVQK